MVLKICKRYKQPINIIDFEMDEINVPIALLILTAMSTHTHTHTHTHVTSQQYAETDLK